MGVTSMSRFNTSTSHPLIPNSQEYMFEQQYISIDSSDRNMVKYPKANDFEIELPQDYTNVQGFRLVSGCFPINNDTFSKLKKNVTFTFQITDPYNPTDNGVVDPTEISIYESLALYAEKQYVVIIENGSYTDREMVNELANRMNYAVTEFLLGTDSNLTASQKSAYQSLGGYKEFLVEFNSVSGRLWVGNQSSAFTLSNNYVAKYEEDAFRCLCDAYDNALPDFKHWGLPGYLGFTRCDEVSKQQVNETDTRFFHQSYNWLAPNSALNGAKAYYVEAPNKMNLHPPCYFFLDIKLLNFMDQTSPYDYSKFTQETNQTNGIVKSAFAKIPLQRGVDSGNYYENMNQANYYKIYNPPVERIRKLSIRVRHHNGMLVDFGNTDMSFTLEMTMFRPQNNRAYHMRIPESIATNY